IQAMLSELIDDISDSFNKNDLRTLILFVTNRCNLKCYFCCYKDSLNSTRAAIDEGIVVGAGIGLLRASRNVHITLSDEENIGAQILIQACEAPLKQIIVNSGLDSAIIFNEILNKESQFGLNAVTGKMEDLLKNGIVDPLKVLRSALQCAVSTATLILFSEVLIGYAPEKE
ncbi:MAG: TCP-1/cpn60 chaperonin family protein, partial [Verrucomicrobiota bacterium]